MGIADVTIRHVARDAEVSVSCALDGHSNVHPDVLARVLAATGSFGYVPHFGACSLGMARTNLIGTVIFDMHAKFFPATYPNRAGTGRARTAHDDAMKKR